MLNCGKIAEKSSLVSLFVNFLVAKVFLKVMASLLKVKQAYQERNIAMKMVHRAQRNKGVHWTHSLLESGVKRYFPVCRPGEQTTHN